MITLVYYILVIGLLLASAISQKGTKYAIFLTSDNGILPGNGR